MQQGQVDELVYDAVLAGIVGQNGILLGPFFAHLLLDLFQRVFVGSRDFVVFLALLCFVKLFVALLQVGQRELQRSQVGGACRFGIFQHVLDELVVGVDHHVEHVGHFAVETHARLDACHFFHAAHVFALRNQYGSHILAQGLCLDIEFHLVYPWHLAAEHGGKHFALVAVERCFVHFVFDDETVYHVAVHTGEACLLVLALQQADKGHVQLAVHQQHVVAFVFGGFDVAELFFRIVGIQIDEVAFLVGLLALCQVLIFVVGVVMGIGVFEQGELVGFVVEVFLCQHAVVDEDFQVVPFAFKVLAVAVED